jgi:NADPH:quinone reductase-like Zn-dependent oxidoreductase
MTFIRALIIGCASLCASVGVARAEETMHAIRYQTTGPSSVLQYDTVPRPTPGPGEVLVKVMACGVNPVDGQLRSRPADKDQREFPIIPGHDIAGRVVAVGPGVSRKLVSSNVFALLSWKGGAYAEYVTVPVDAVASKPKRLSYIEAAAVPLAGLTAYQALFTDGHLRAGQTVLIHGGSGGVGHLAIQLAKHAGARVIATASTQNLDFLRSAGADVVVDYRTQKFEDFAHDVDLVLDTVGGDTLVRSYAVVRHGGTVISLVQVPDLPVLADRAAHGMRTLVHPDQQQLKELAALADQGVIKPAIAATYPLDKAGAAQDDLERLHRPGKVVLLSPSLQDSRADLGITSPQTMAAGP